MAVDVFTKEEFEKQALPVNKDTGAPLWDYLGLRDGEHAYLVKMPKNNVGIEVRSSVKANGVSAATGKDSIRCWLVDQITKEPMGSKISRWTTRMPGWGERTKEVIRQLWAMGQKIIPCPSCKTTTGDNRLRCFKVKKEGPNKGKLFLKCPNEHCKHFEWVDAEEDGEVKAPTTTDNRHGMVMDEPCPDCKGVVKQWQSRKEGNNKGRYFFSCHGTAPENKGCGFFQWAEDEAPAPPKKKTQTLSVEIPDDMVEELQKFLAAVGGKIK
jgi:hypothetical protein